MGELVWAVLDVPRTPTAAELDLLRTLAAVAGDPRLDEQVTTAAVTGACRCGCSSVRLGSEAPAIPAAEIARLSGTGRDDHLAITAMGRDGRRELVSVTLHVVDGRVAELEVFAVERGEGVAVSLTGITDLDDPAVH